MTWMRQHDCGSAERVTKVPRLEWSRCSRRRAGAAGAFTLIELILGIAIMAVVLLAVNAVFFTSLRLQEGTHAAVEEAMPLEHAMAVIRRDLQGAVPPPADASILVGHFKTGGVNALATGMPVEAEFCTTTGVIRDDEPWGEVQMVTYSLQPSGDSSRRGQDLMRGVTRNLLATILPAPEQERLLGGVEAIEFAGYDGYEWRTYWDTEMTDTNLPSAVRVRITLAARTGSGRLQTAEMVVPIWTQTRSNAVTTEMTEGGFF